MDNAKSERFKSFLKKYKNEILFLVAFILMMLFYRCPVKLIFGFDCPGCGMSRAFLALCRLDFKAAHDYHPMIFVVVIEFAYYILTRYIIKKNFSKKAENAILTATAIVMIVIWALRLIVF